MKTHKKSDNKFSLFVGVGGGNPMNSSPDRHITHTYRNSALHSHTLYIPTACVLSDWYKNKFQEKKFQAVLLCVGQNRKSGI